MANPGIMVVEGMQDVAGAVVWWGLEGEVSHAELSEVWLSLGLDEKLLPGLPSVETALQRALQAAAKSKRQMVRPLQTRGQWAIVTESPYGSSLDYTINVRALVETLEDGSKRGVITPNTDGDRHLASVVVLQLGLQSGVLSAEDISSWLTFLLRGMQAVPLRPRGGFYFMPNFQLEMWRRVVSVVKSVSAHEIYEIPALRTEEAVDAVLKSVRREAAQAMEELEAYLQGDTSTRGLNAWERDLAAVRFKVGRYASLLEVALPDLEERASVLLGGITAAKILQKEAAK